MALHPTVFLVHVKIIQGTTPPNGSIPVPDFLLQMAAKAAGMKVDKPASAIDRIYNLSQKLEEIRATAAPAAVLSVPIPSVMGQNGVWVESPDNVVARATDQVDSGQPDFTYSFEFTPGEVTEVEFCASLGYA
jgi:hypothetical protein